jgi:hypothetical protein
LPEVLNNSRRDKPRFFGEFTTYLLVVEKGRKENRLATISFFIPGQKSIYLRPGNTCC